MKTLFSTTDVHPRDRFAYWHEVACKTIVRHDSRPSCPLQFKATIRAQNLAGLGVLAFENSPMSVNRTTANIASAPSDFVFLCRQLAGRSGFEQQGRHEQLAPGDMTVIDGQIPYAGEFGIGSRRLTLKIPRRDLQARFGNFPELLGRKLSSRSDVGLALVHQLALFERGLPIADVAAQVAVRDYTLDLIALSLTQMTGSASSTQSAARSLAFSNLRASIEMRLPDPELDGRSAARAAGISVRYANDLLRERDTSLVKWIHERRLDQCQKVLADPLQRHRTISEVAFGWGFSDLTHFGRLFKQRYGLSPRDYRTRQLQRRQLS